jgi:hypothetical protein
MKVTETDKLQSIFQKQGELIEKFHPIEAANGLLHHPDVPVPLDDKFGQAHLRDLAWRIVEEISEAYRSYSDPDHREEELADALHFLVELAITSGLEPKDLGEFLEEVPGVDLLDGLFEFERIEPGEVKVKIANFIGDLGMSINELKNRAWKQKHTPTNQKKYKDGISVAFYSFICVCKSVGMTANSLHGRYMAKHAVNEKRIADKF